MFQHVSDADCDAAAGDQIFLNGRETFKWNFNTHVTTSDHDAIALRADFIDVVIAGLVFNLGDQLNGIIFSK